MAKKKRKCPPRRVWSPVVLADVNVSDNAVLSDLLEAKTKLETAIEKSKEGLAAVNAAIAALD